MSPYIVITPVRNEEAHIGRTIQSMVAQTVRPLRWVIVNDGSTDQTGRLLNAAAREHDWIVELHRADRGFRKQGSGVIEAFYDGYALLSGPSSVFHGPQVWSFLVKLDGDLSFAPDYFERCLRHFESQPRLGIAGGTVCCYTAAQGWVVDSPGDPPFHVRGATKIYRRACWEQIGGLIRAPGWDTVDEVKANMLGWQTRTFPELEVRQHKDTGSADGTWQNWVKNGLANYITGYHPLFMLAKCLRRTVRRPYLLSGAGLWWGFCRGYLRGVPRVSEPQVIRYVREQQLNKLLLRPSLW